jgi:hypothetical protein
MFSSLFTKSNLRVTLLFFVPLLCARTVDAGEFRYNGETHSIEMKGTIRTGDGMKFSSLLKAHPETEGIKLLSSVGGEYTSSLEISLEVKRHGLTTVSSNYCHSGCAYIWLAGATRTVVGSANPEIHLPYANATGEVFPKLTYAWLEALGLSSTFADAVVQSVGPDNRFVKLTPDFLTKFGA